MTPTFTITAYKIFRGFLERQIAVMQGYTHENSTMETAHPREHFGKHSTACAVFTFASRSYYWVIRLSFAIRI